MSRKSPAPKSDLPSPAAAALAAIADPQTIRGLPFDLAISRLQSIAAQALAEK